MKYLYSLSTIILILLFTTNPILGQDSLEYGPDHLKTDYELKSELNLVYVGASWCPPCVKDSFKEALEEIKVALYERAKEENMNYSVIGVANDLNVKKGWEFLNSSGYFDEVIIGKRWLNSGSIEYILKHKDVLPGVPQIIVFSRPLEFGEKAIIGEKEILARKIGEEAMRKWIQAGAPINFGETQTAN